MTTIADEPNEKSKTKRGFVLRCWDLALELWQVLIRPSSVFGLGVLVLAGFAAGVIFWGGFNAALELTNTEKFCTDCHEMRENVFAELKSTIHFSNRSGGRATCPDCPRSAPLDRQDRAQDAGLEGGLGQDFRHDRHPREVSGSPARARGA
jgi:cytochrome c-type protein NapC